ncbi:MAG: class I adenylate cyclase, partial [Gammaproteobacteria bacterium]
MSNDATASKQLADLRDQQAIKDRFMAVNSARLERVHSSLGSRQRDFLDLLPLLFHLNHPMLPGYRSNNTPAGISNYKPNERSLDAAQRLSKSFTVPAQARSRPDLLAVYLMGSTGSIAQSSDSDFDIWICHRQNMSREQLQDLQSKAEQIQHWATSLGLETHFFIQNDKDFRSGTHRQLSAESSGSVQHQLLVEEFYRTGLLVAGRYPVWWMVPPEHEHDYENYVAMLLRKRLIMPSEILDFGGLNKLLAGEFFGGALWQLSKAIDSPYKSVLKILLTEAYSSEYPNVEPLCLRFKKAIYDGTAEVDQLDPYVLMCTKVEEYLLKHNDIERRDLIRRCFYFKVNEPLSQVNHLYSLNWRRSAMRRLVASWGWRQSTLRDLDARKNWKIQRVLAERKSMVDALTRSYHTLSRFARENARQAAVDPADLNLLGRKLFAAFERKAGKVDLVNPGISTNPTESSLSLHRIDRPGQEGWLLYSGDVTASDTHNQPAIKQTHNLLELLAWCHINGLVHPVTTVFHYHPQRGSLHSRELRSVLDCLRKLFPGGRLPSVDMQDLASTPRVLKGGLFVNLGLDPLARLTRHGRQLLTDHTDVFRYGGSKENLALTFDQIVVTSWKEVLTFSYSGETALLDCICDYLAWTTIDSDHLPPPLPCYSFSSPRGTAIAQRIQKLFQDLVDLFYRDPRRHRARYVLHLKDAYYVLQPENGVPRYQRFRTYGGLLRHLGTPQQVFSSVFIDRHSLQDTPLPLIFSSNRPDQLQLFYELSDDRAKIFLVDEKGSLFYEEKQIDDKTAF